LCRCSLAEVVGKEITHAKAVMLCGGRSGVMTAVARGAAEEGGITLGILSGFRRENQYNLWIQVAVYRV
jgi:uncharacterized protein (TIGR00725 family)